LQARARTDPALLAIQVDGSLISHAVVPSGGSIPVAVSLGHVARGPHRVTVEPVAGFSAAAIDPDPVFTLTDVDDPASVVLRHAPILFGRTPEVIHDGLNGLLVPAGDPDPMAQAIDSVLLRPELAARLAAAGGRDSERYDADAQVERVLEAYREALAGRPRRQPSEGVPPEFTASLGPGHVASVRSGS
jgi:hypothetical protein